MIKSDVKKGSRTHKIWQREEQVQRPWARNVLGAFKALLQEQPTLTLETRKGTPGGQRWEDRKKVQGERTGCRRVKGKWIICSQLEPESRKKTHGLDLHRQL